MNPLLFLIVTTVAAIVGGLIFRLWLRRQADPRGTYRRVCGFIMWLGCLICVAALVLSLVSKTQPVWLLTSSGLLIVVSMLLARQGPAARQDDKIGPGPARPH